MFHTLRAAAKGDWGGQEDVDSGGGARVGTGLGEGGNKRDEAVVVRCQEAITMRDDLVQLGVFEWAKAKAQEEQHCKNSHISL